MTTKVKVTLHLTLEEASKLNTAAKLLDYYADYNKNPESLTPENKEFMANRSLCGRMINLWWYVAKRCSKEEIMERYGYTNIDWGNIKENEI